jgi:hypothetical protein
MQDYIIESEGNQIKEVKKRKGGRDLMLRSE